MICKAYQFMHDIPLDVAGLITTHQSLARHMDTVQHWYGDLLASHNTVPDFCQTDNYYFPSCISSMTFGWHKITPLSKSTEQLPRITAEW